MDPQHRLLLQHALGVLSSTNLQPSEQTAVVVGITHGDYAAGDSLLSISNYTATGLFSSVAAGRCVSKADMWMVTTLCNFRDAWKA